MLGFRVEIVIRIRVFGVYVGVSFFPGCDSEEKIHSAPHLQNQLLSGS